jgi:hypothetical protein
MRTIRAKPSLASHAPIDNKIILVNRESADDIDRQIGISITNLNINASNDKRDISRWFLFKIRAIIADTEDKIIIVLYEFISIIYIIYINSDNIHRMIYNSQSYNFN